MIAKLWVVLAKSWSGTEEEWFMVGNGLDPGVSALRSSALARAREFIAEQGPWTRRFRVKVAPYVPEVSS